MMRKFGDSVILSGNLAVSGDAFVSGDHRVGGKITGATAVHPAYSGHGHNIGEKDLHWGNLYVNTGYINEVRTSSQTIILGDGGATISAPVGGKIELLGSDGVVTKGLELQALPLRGLPLLKADFFFLVI